MKYLIQHRRRRPRPAIPRDKPTADQLSTPPGHDFRHENIRLYISMVVEQREVVDIVLLEDDLLLLTVVVAAMELLSA